MAEPAEVGAAASCTDRMLGLAGQMGGLGFRLRAFAAVLNPGLGMDVLCEAQPERLVCQKFKSLVLRFPFVPKR